MGTLLGQKKPLEDTLPYTESDLHREYFGITSYFQSPWYGSEEGGLVTLFRF